MSVPTHVAVNGTVAPGWHGSNGPQYELGYRPLVEIRPSNLKPWLPCSATLPGSPASMGERPLSDFDGVGRGELRAPRGLGPDDTEAVTASGAASLAESELGAVGVAELHATRPRLPIASAMNSRDSRVSQKRILLLLWSRITLGPGWGPPSIRARGHLGT